MRKIVLLLGLILSGFGVKAREVIFHSCDSIMVQDSVVVDSLVIDSCTLVAVPVVADSLALPPAVEDYGLDSLRCVIACKNDTLNMLRNLITCKNDTLARLKDSIVCKNRQLDDTLAYKSRQLQLLSDKLSEAENDIINLKKERKDKELRKLNKKLCEDDERDSMLIASLRADSLRNVEYRAGLEAFIKEFERVESQLVCDSVLKMPFSVVEQSTFDDLLAWIKPFVGDSVVPELKRNVRRGECETFSNLIYNLSFSKNCKKRLTLCDSLLSAHFNAQVLITVKEDMEYDWEYLYPEQQAEFQERFAKLDRYADTAILLDSVLTAINGDMDVSDYRIKATGECGEKQRMIWETNLLEVIRVKISAIDEAKFDGLPFMAVLYRGYREAIEADPLKIKTASPENGESVDVDAIENEIRSVAAEAKKYKNKQ